MKTKQSYTHNLYGNLRLFIAAQQIWILSLFSFILAMVPANAQDILWGLSSRGSENAGAIFSMNSDSTNFTVHKDFTSVDGRLPVGDLLLGNDDFLYGMTRDGGDFDQGVIYKIKIDGTDFSVIRHLNVADGIHPTGSLEWGGDGFIYGPIRSGGDHNGGTVFKIRPDGSDFQVLKHFDQNDADEAWAPEALLLADNGDLFGTANGGTFFTGVIFRMSTDGSSYTILRHLNDPDGRFPIGGLIQGADGYIYGLTEEGGVHNRGTAYKINTDGSDFQVLRNFDRTEEGFFPTGKLLEHPDGVFYGVVHHGEEEEGDGSIYRLNADGSDFTVIHDFISTIGGTGPTGGLKRGSDGFLYGMTINSIYKIKPDGSDFSEIREFIGTYGSIRGLAILLQDCPPPSVSPIQFEPSSPIALDTPVLASAAFIGHPDSASWDWGDGNSSVAAIGDSLITGSHQYDASGEYTVTLTVADSCGTSETTQTLTVLSQTGGSIKGGGTINSPIGAYTKQPSVSGKAHYQINAHFHKTDQQLIGKTNFRIADLKFQSTDYEFLIVEGNTALLKGEGKINGKGQYGFLIAAVDSQDKGEKDKLRVKIWDKDEDDELVYDNQMGDPGEAAASQPIEKGVIIILEGKTQDSLELNGETVQEQLKKIKAFPNPVQDRVFIDLGDLSPDVVNTVVNDAYGSMELHNIHKVDANLLEFDLSGLKQGFYYIRIRTAHGDRSIKLLKK